MGIQSGSSPGTGLFYIGSHARPIGPDSLYPERVRAGPKTPSGSELYGFLRDWNGDNWKTTISDSPWGGEVVNPPWPLYYWSGPFFLQEGSRTARIRVFRGEQTFHILRPKKVLK